VPVEIAAAGHRALASDVERGQRVELPGIGQARDHPILLLHRRVGRGRLHATVFNGWPDVFVEIGQHRRGLDRLSREAERRRRTHRPGRFQNRSPVLGDEQARHPVIGPHALDIVLNHGDAGRLPIFDRLMQFVDRRFFETKRLFVCHDPPLCSGPPVAAGLFSRLAECKLARS